VDLFFFACPPRAPLRDAFLSFPFHSSGQRAGPSVAVWRVNTSSRPRTNTVVSTSTLSLFRFLPPTLSGMVTAPVRKAFDGPSRCPCPTSSLSSRGVWSFFEPSCWDKIYSSPNALPPFLASNFFLYVQSRPDHFSALLPRRYLTSLQSRSPPPHSFHPGLCVLFDYRTRCSLRAEKF